MTLPRLSLFDTDPADIDADAIVIGVHTSGGEPDGTLLLGGGAESITAAFEDRLIEALRLLGATGASGELTKLATLGAVSTPLLVAVGLGAEPSGTAPAPDVLRRAAGAAVRALAGSRKVAIVLPVPDDEGLAQVVRAVAEGAALGGYRFDRYRSTPPRREPVGEVMIHVPDARDRAAVAEIERAAVVTSVVARARDWVNTPPNDLRPPDFADQVAAAAAEAGLEVTVLDEEALRRDGYGGLLAVGSGSQAPPRLVRLDYRPASGGPVARVALVGKGITFDTGGVSLKPSQAMITMKSDMAGAAAVAAVMLAVAALKPQVAVTGWLPVAENMPSGSSYRPGDVVTMYGGKKVEVLNTDAEGRMILADAIARACEEEPDLLLETSTLTGGQLVALGKQISGVMGTPEVCERVRAAGELTGEPAWPMPLPEEVRRGMDSSVADICQINANQERVATMLQGGTFLAEFVTPGLPWAHIDIAGPSFHTGEATGYLTKGGTGVPIRTLLQIIEELPSSPLSEN